MGISGSGPAESGTTARQQAPQAGRPWNTQTSGIEPVR